MKRKHLEVRLNLDTLDYYKRVARAAGVRLNDVFNVVLAMQVTPRQLAPKLPPPKGNP